jgi:D-serine deaminase-like pyridoxal phosphate-dependent protein
MPVIALKQIEMGAVGVCVQKVSEAEAMVYGGDPTVNLYDWYVCIRNNRVEQVWPITARGAVY